MTIQNSSSVYIAMISCDLERPRITDQLPIIWSVHRIITRNCAFDMWPRPDVNKVLFKSWVSTCSKGLCEVRVEAKPRQMIESVHPGFGVGLRSLYGPDVMRFTVICYVY